MDLLYFPLDAWPEKLIRSVIVYVFLLAAFRLTGKRRWDSSPVRPRRPADHSNVLRTPRSVRTSLTGGLLGAVAILSLNWMVTEITYRSKRARRILEQSQRCSSITAVCYTPNLHRERITMASCSPLCAGTGRSSPRKRGRRPGGELQRERDSSSHREKSFGRSGCAPRRP